MSRKLVLVRHGQSVWNLSNRFTGWKDVDLSDLGRQEAAAAGKLLKSEGFQFQYSFCSVLTRALRTLAIILDEMDMMWLPTEKAWELNERHYGALQGLDKAETLAKHGPEQVLLWRRSYDYPPPALSKDDPEHPRFDPRYRGLTAEQLPDCESLKDTLARVVPYWETKIRPHLLAGEDVLVAAHGNSLRALVKHLNGISDAEITELNIPTGIPLLYEFDDNMKVTSDRYLGDQEAIKAAAEAVKRQTEAKKS